MKSVTATLTVAVLLGAQPVAGQIGDPVGSPSGEAAPRTQERTHTVRPGDTLWGLAGQYYANPFTWPTIFDANRGVVENAHWIYPNEVLVIPGAPTAVAEGPPDAPGQITPVGAAVQVATADPERRTRFYRQNEVTGQIQGDDPRTRMVVQPGEHYAAPWLANPDGMPVIGRVLRTTDAPESDDELGMQVHPFDDVYVEYRGSTRPQPGERLLVVVRFREYDDGDDLFVIRPAGVLTVRSTEGGVMTARVSQHWAPFGRGALVVPMDAFDAIPGPHRPLTDGPVGRITGFMVEQPLYGTTDYGFVDLDASQVRLGDVIMVYRTPDAEDRTLPPEPVAFAKIVRIGPVGSTFLVTQVMQRRLDRGLHAQVVSRLP